MNAPRSIRFKLISLYVVLLSCVFIAFGAYTYWGFQQFLVRSLEQVLFRRAEQIAVTIVDRLPQKGEAYVAGEIQARYAPELNERVIRIADANNREIYTSKNAQFLNAYPSPTVPDGRTLGRPLYWRQTLEDGKNFLVTGVPYRLSNQGIYTVEVGAPEADMTNALRDLLFTLMLGFPVLIGLAILGGYFLLGRALRPVDRIVGAAERITFKNIHERLPVPATGDEFETISEALNRMIDRLDEAFQIANRFTADASHELRTLLTIIQGELEIFTNDRSLPPEAVERAGNVLEEVVRLSQIVEGLLLVSRLEAGEAQMKMEPIDLGELTTFVAEQLELLARDKMLTFTCETKEGVEVEGDELRLQQVVVNLVDNAIKYTPEGGLVSLKVWAENNRAVIEVSDNGMGISPTALPRVFHRFFRSEEAKARRVEGSGLGLSIVQSIVDAHGGSIAVQSDSQGTRFRVILPLWQGAPARRKGSEVAA